MWAKGPEELLVRARVDPRAELAQYARFEGSRAGVRATDALLRRELDFLPVKRSPMRRFLRWVKGEGRYDRAPLAAAPAVSAGADVPGARAAAVRRAVGKVGLAALPVVQEEGLGRGLPAPVVMLPFLTEE